VFTKPNYDAECSYSSDGRFILYAHVETPTQEGEKANADIFIFDTVTKRHHAIVVGPGYDGGPFFSPDDKRICYRSDRKGDDLLQLFVADLRWVDGVPVGMEREYQITDNGAVNWAPYFSRDGGMLIYGSSEVGHHNYELFAVTLDAATMAQAASKAGDARTVLVNDLPRTRLTHADGADVLPVFSNDGKTVMWTSQRGPKVQGEARPSSQLWVATWGGLPAR
jgi:Tol biopolymer transport system component